MPTIDHIQTGKLRLPCPWNSGYEYFWRI